MGNLFESSYGFSWGSFATGVADKKDKIYMTHSDLGLLTALIDSYRNQRDGTWKVKSTTLDNQKGIKRNHIYELEINKSKTHISIGFGYNKEEMDKYLIALDSLAFKIASTPEGKNVKAIDLEADKINAYSLNIFKNGDKRVIEWSCKTLLVDIQRYSTLVEFQSLSSTEGNRKSTER